MKKKSLNAVVIILWVLTALFVISMIATVISSAAGGTLTFMVVFQYVVSNLAYPAIFIGLAEIIRLLLKNGKKQHKAHAEKEEKAEEQAEEPETAESDDRE